MGMVDELLMMLKDIDPSVEPKYNKFYIGLAKNGQVDNFVTFRPRKNIVLLDVKLPKSEDVDHKLSEAGLETLEYNSRWRYYPVRLGKADIKNHSGLLQELMRLAFETRHG